MCEEKTFRSSFWLLWGRLSFNTAIAIFICTTISQLANGLPIFNADHLLLTLTIILGTSLLAVPFVLSHIYYFPIVVTSKCIVGFTYVYPNRKVTLTWSEISELQDRSRVGIPCYRLYSESRNLAILIPKTLKHRKEMEEIFIKHNLKNKGSQPTVVAAKPTKVYKALVSEPVREGGYIVISTEQDRVSKKN
jgi:hypothetical protein